MNAGQASHQKPSVSRDNDFGYLPDNHSQKIPYVYLAWDLQNVKVKLRQMPILGKKLLELVASKGRLDKAIVYYNSQHENQLAAQKTLESLGIKGRDVPSSLENSADNELIVGVINRVARKLSPDILILVLGDRDYAGLICLLKALPKKITIIIVARKGNVSQKIIDIADEFYYVEKILNLGSITTSVSSNSLSGKISYEDAIACLIESIQIVMQKGKRATLSYVNQIMGDNSSFPNYQNVSSIRKQDGMTFSRFHKFIEAAMKDGIIGIRLNGDLPELFLVKSSP